MPIAYRFFLKSVEQDILDNEVQDPLKPVVENIITSFMRRISFTNIYLMFDQVEKQQLIIEHQYRTIKTMQESIKE